MIIYEISIIVGISVEKMHIPVMNVGNGRHYECPQNRKRPSDRDRIVIMKQKNDG